MRTRFRCEVHQNEATDTHFVWFFYSCATFGYQFVLTVLKWPSRTTEAEFRTLLRICCQFPLSANHLQSLCIRYSVTLSENHTTCASPLSVPSAFVLVNHYPTGGLLLVLALRHTCTFIESFTVIKILQVFLMYCSCWQHEDNSVCAVPFGVVVAY